MSVDPRMTAAAGLHGSPGVYALMLGSGTSTSAGIPTGWGVVRRLVAIAAAAGSPDDQSSVDAALEDPELWWSHHGTGPLGYSQILAQLGPTPAARAALLNEFFVPTDDERIAGQKVPGKVHHAIAELVRRRIVRVIITTNFDRLIETALNEAGMPPQVISSASQIAAMEPLAHAACTVIKLHGDYSDLDKRNTIDELDHYDPETVGLLTQILEDYGLVVCGWSADWDIALVDAFNSIKNRRYPLYWSTFGAVSDATRKLIVNRGAIVIPDVMADDFFTDLCERIDALDRLAESPLTTAVAVERLKRVLLAPDSAIRVHDLLNQEISKIDEAVRTWDNRTDKTVDNGLALMAAHSQTLLHLLANGIYFDQERRHLRQWTRTIDRLLRIRPARSFAENRDPRERLKHYPALLAMLLSTIVATAVHNEEVVMSILRDPEWQELEQSAGPLSAANVLNYWNVLDEGSLKQLARFSGQNQNFRFFSSELALADLRGALGVLSLNPVEVGVLFEDAEYRVALAQMQFRPSNKSIYCLEPRVGLAYSHRFRMQDSLPAQDRFAAKPETYEQWGLSSVTLDHATDALREALKAAVRGLPY